MSDIANCVKQILNTNMQVKTREVVSVVFDGPTADLALAFEQQATQIGAIYHGINMDEYRARLHNQDFSVLIDLYRKQLSDNKTAISLFLATQQEGEDVFRKGVMLTPLQLPHLKIAHGHMPTASAEMIEKAFCKDNAPVIALNNKVYELMQGVEYARITSKGGTDLHVTFEPRYMWVNASGVVPRGKGSNIIPAEVYTCPNTCNGTLVVDGLLGTRFAEEFGSLSRNPVTIYIKDGYVADVDNDIHCDNKDIERALKQYMITGNKFANRVGEFAVATNFLLRDYSNAISLDEKVIGVHLALGDPYKIETGADWETNRHVDLIMQQPSLTVYKERKGILIMKKGIFAHPELVKIIPAAYRVH